jgi:hypothetical protein
MDFTRASINEQIAIDRLPLLDLEGREVNLGQYFDAYLLVIFLRHLA